MQLAEEAGVLDRDDTLIGEGPEQRDCLVGEAIDRPMGDADCADGLAAAQERYGDQAPQVCPDGGDARELGVCLEIGDVDDGPVENGDSHRERTFRRSREALDDAVDGSDARFS